MVAEPEVGFVERLALARRSSASRKWKDGKYTLISM